MSINPSGEINYGNDLNQLNSPVTTTWNTDVHRIVINEDRARLLLNDQVDQLKHIVENREKWKTPFGILVSLGIVFPTCEFHDFIFPSTIWLTIFILATIASLGFTIVYGVKASMTKSKSEKDIIDNIISEFSADSRGSQAVTSQEST